MAEAVTPLLKADSASTVYQVLRGGFLEYKGIADSGQLIIAPSSELLSCCYSLLCTILSLNNTVWQCLCALVPKHLALGKGLYCFPDIPAWQGSVHTLFLPLLEQLCAFTKFANLEPGCEAVGTLQMRPEETSTNLSCSDVCGVDFVEHQYCLIHGAQKWAVGWASITAQSIKSMCSSISTCLVRHYNLICKMVG